MAWTLDEGYVPASIFHAHFVDKTLINVGANEMDGAVGLTQCIIGPSKSFTYKFKIDDNQAGTFW